MNELGRMYMFCCECLFVLCFCALDWVIHARWEAGYWGIKSDSVANIDRNKTTEIGKMNQHFCCFLLILFSIQSNITKSNSGGLVVVVLLPLTVGWWLKWYYIRRPTDSSPTTVSQWMLKKMFGQLDRWAIAVTGMFVQP